jgi:hypothetical protein
MNVKEKIIPIIAYGLSLAMGVASIVLSILGEPVDPMLYSISITVLGLAGLESIAKKESE